MTVICKVCGYITSEDHLKDVCPACGVKRTAFEPYSDRVKPARRKLLNLKIHSMTVHFPQAIAMIVFFLIFVSRFAGSSIFQPIQSAAKVLVVLLPFSIVASLISGVFEGKIRLKKLSTPLLKTKMVAAAVFLIVSIVLLWVKLSTLEPSWIILSGLSGLCALTAVFLGKKGGSLIGVEVSG